MRSLSLPALTSSLALGALLISACQPAAANSLFSITPTLRVAVSGAESQAQLAAQLRAQGYTNVILSAAYPNPENPQPQTNPSLTGNPAQTPVHDGWNGVAQKNGAVVQVYAQHN
ncbi:MAG: hypothetical protein B7X08_04180 [Acidocella sp. 20-63-7]|nr:MAG: hypothetical protein B7X08_04180 [Acidocella sp. 20-63-7]HQT46058.1 hypothetical protein [Acidocella sp.]